MVISTQTLDERIATVKGWTLKEYSTHYFWRNREGKAQALPKWSSSLDLMHELISELTSEEYEQYLSALGVGIAGDIMIDDWTIDCVALRTAMESTAAQKAEAWLKVKEQ